MKKTIALILTTALAVTMFLSCTESKKQITIGLSVDQLFESRVATNDGVKAEAEKHGIKVIEVVADGDPQLQNSQVQSLITQQVDALLVCAVDQNTIDHALRKADKAGIPIVAYDRDLPDSKAVNVFVGPDSHFDGFECGKYVAEQLEDESGEILILELLGALNDQNGIDRSKGFNDALKVLPNAKIIQMPTDWSSDKALAAVQNAFQANPEIRAIFAATDTQVPSIETVLTDMGKLKKIGEDGHVIVVGVNGSYDGYISVAKGTADGITVMDCHATGETAVQLALKLIKGEAVDENTVIPGKFYTTENIEANKSTIWGAPKEQ
ncbi:MAG: sugar ABC transporter substrate-binding protein [Calditrichaeota bacterium]|nr:MAG: sugar ABC transporter substrate-binding protein [Calditrichota bacterium]